MHHVYLDDLEKGEYSRDAIKVWHVKYFIVSECEICLRGIEYEKEAYGNIGLPYR